MANAALALMPTDMKHIIYSATFAAALLSSTQITTLALAQVGVSEPAQAIDASMKDDVAWDIVEGITTEIGPRQAGTEAEARARVWSVAKLKSLGINNARIEEYQMPTWVRGDETA